MGALVDLWKSERGLIAVALILAATTLSAVGTITAPQWLEFTKWIFVAYASAKTISSVAEARAATPEAGNPLEVLAAIAGSLARTPQRDPATTPPATVIPPVPPTT